MNTLEPLHKMVHYKMVLDISLNVDSKSAVYKQNCRLCKISAVVEKHSLPESRFASKISVYDLYLMVTDGVEMVQHKTADRYLTSGQVLIVTSIALGKIAFCKL